MPTSLPILSIRLSPLAGAVSAALLAGCPSTTMPRPYAAPTAPALIEHIRSLRQHASTLNAETKTDVRLGDQRANVTVYMLAAPDGKLRFQALDPNNSTAADLASNGKTYCMLDVHANCGECGPATPENVARLVRIPLEPDEIVTVLLGGAPVLEGDATDEWDPNGGHEVLTLRAGDRVERILLDGRDQRWDVLEADMTAGGKTVWSLRHKDFHEVTADDGQKVRLPGASLFEQGGDTVRILWHEQKVGMPLDDQKFQIELPAGLPHCRSRP